MSRTERKLKQALAEIEALRKGVPEMQASLAALSDENHKMRGALETCVYWFGAHRMIEGDEALDSAPTLVVALKALGRTPL